MKRLQFTLVALFILSFVSGQDSGTNLFKYRNSAYVEAGGHGLFYSINYEHLFVNQRVFKTSAHLGISYYPKQTGIRDIWIPVVINEIFSISKHHIELGLGHVFIREASRDMENNPREWFWSGVFTGRIGYRYQKPGGRMTYRIGFTPFLEYEANPVEFYPSAGVSVGYNF